MTARIFYFVADSYPAWRHDVIELFGNELPRRGLKVTWSMRRADAGLYGCGRQCEQLVYLPASLGRNSLFRRLANRWLEAIWEIYLFLILVVGRRYDIVQVRDDRYLAGLWAWLAARLTKAKFIYWLSFPFPENDQEKAKRASGWRRCMLAVRARLAGWWLYRVMLVRADHVFVQSEEMRRDLARYGVPPERMTPVPMGVPAGVLETATSDAVNPTPGLVAYTGTLAASRRLELIIDAFALVLEEIPDARLLIVGDGDTPDERLALEERAGRIGIAAEVQFTGFLPMAEAWRLAATAEIGLSPIYPDRVLRVGSPTKLVEFMALARPVVANHHPEHTWVLSRSYAGLGVDWSPEAFAQAIVFLLRNRAVGQQMGLSGRAWVAANRTYARIADTVWATYETILGTGPHE